MQNKDTIETCPSCGKEFIKRTIRYPSKVDDKRDSYYCCPYCNKSNGIHLMGNEDVTTFKKEK